MTMELCERVKLKSTKLDDSGVQMVYEAANEDLGLFYDVAGEISLRLQKRALYLMVNILPPGIVVPVHTDTLPQPVQRWHLPIQTNRHAYFWDEVDGVWHMEHRAWVRIFPERRHTIFNFGNEDRIHIVVDLEP